LDPFKIVEAFAWVVSIAIDADKTVGAPVHSAAPITFE
jgi:hypothetical protein